jgi:adenylyl-sulfate kinase
MNKKILKRPITIWLTGLSGSGKTSIAFALEQLLKNKGYLCYVLDGDHLRKGLSKDLGFSPEDRKENVRRAAEVARLLNKANHIAIVSLISPYKRDRLMAKEIIGAENFIEVYINAPLEVCEKRDPKGFYKKARAGLIENFTGITDPYESPSNPDIVIHTTQGNEDTCALRIQSFLFDKENQEY